MQDRYFAVRVSRDEFIARYPDAVGTPIGELGMTAFGNEPIRVAERIGRPDFETLQMMMVIGSNDDLYLAFAPHGEPVGYPPDYIKVRVLDLGPGTDSDSIRAYARAKGEEWEGVLPSHPLG